MDTPKKTFYQYLKSEIENGKTDFVLHAVKDPNSNELLLNIGTMQEAQHQVTTGTMQEGQDQVTTESFKTSGAGSNYIKIKN